MVKLSGYEWKEWPHSDGLPWRGGDATALNAELMAGWEIAGFVGDVPVLRRPIYEQEEPAKAPIS